MKAMLAKRNITREQLEDYLQDENYSLQPKHDGHRVLCKLGAGEVAALNRKGEPSQHQETMTKILGSYANTYDEPNSVILDGELINHDTYVVFDVVRFEELVDAETAYYVRLEAAKHMIKPTKHLYTVIDCKSEMAKRALIEIVTDMDGEGVVVKKRMAFYEAGKRSDNLIKCKFYKTVDLVVLDTQVEGKEKFTFGAYDHRGKMIEIGGTKNLYEVEAGDVIELRYLAQSDDVPPRLTQPVLIRRREDKAPKECTLDQFKVNRYA